MTIARIPDHLTVDEGSFTASCRACSTSVDCPSWRFGPFSVEDMLATFLIQHSVHTKGGVPAGLTASGKPTKAAVAAFAEAQARAGAS